MPRDLATGIDLGTTNSAMAWVDETGRSAMILNAEGEVITPSIVFFSESEVVVGRGARTAVTSHPDMVAQWVKRDMGSAYYSHPIRGQYLPPEVIQACILRKLKSDLTRAVGDHVQTVITVPAYFDEMRRKATADAGEMAGLRILDIVNEPTAAALAFGESLGYLSASGGTSQELNVLVYDLGGGTFDATLLHLAPGKIQTFATDGDVQLGGHDWDQRLVNVAAENFKKTHGLDPRDDPAVLNRLYEDAMEAKHTLSARNRTKIRVAYAGKTADTQVSREQFEEMSADLLERTAYTSRQLLAAAKLQWNDVHRILLVGGSTRMPMVGAMLRKLTGIEPDRSVNPDEAVARGAALYANYLLSKQQASPQQHLVVSDVNSHSLGVEGIDNDTLRKKNVVLIPRNTPLPVTFTERFATKSEGQRSIAIKVLEGESSTPAECIAIGRTVIGDLPEGLPRGWPIEVTFHYGTNGRLAVRATVPGTQHEAVLELLRDVGVSDESRARWRVLVCSGAGAQAFESVATEAGLGPAAARPAGAGGVGSGSNLGWALASARNEALAPPAPSEEPPAAPVPVAAVAPQTSQPTQTPVVAEIVEPRVTVRKPARPSQRKRRVPVWIAKLAGHILAAGLGLGTAYLLLRYFRPDLLP
jgi:molecular chaperone DnaK